MIRINKATLTAFGKFHSKEISFEDGLQIFYGANEAGKSTLQLFFRVMLYGVPNQRKSINVALRDRERMIPWGEKYAEGSLTLTVDKTTIEIYRRFGKTPAGDRLEVTHAFTGEPLSQYQGEDLGMQLFGMSAEMFEKTFWLRQDSVFPIGTDEELGRKLMNLRETGEEDFSAQSCIKALEQEQKALRAKDKRATAGMLDILYQEREEKVKERYMLLSEMEQRKLAQMRRDEAEKQLKNAQDEAEILKELEEKQKKIRDAETVRSKWKEAKRLQELIENASEDASYIKFFHATEETLNEAEFIKRKLETLDQSTQIGYDKDATENRSNVLIQKKKKGGMLVCIGATILLVSLILGILRIPLWQVFLASGILVSIALSGFGAMMLLKAGKSLIALQKETKEAEKELFTRKEEVMRLQNDLKAILLNYACGNVEELRKGFELSRKVKLETESYRRAMETLLAGENIETLKQEMTELGESSAEEQELLMRNLGEELLLNQKRQMDALSTMKELEGKLSYVYHEGRNPADVQAEIDRIDEDIAQGEERLKAAQLALKVFQNVYEIRKSDFTPEVNEKVNEFLGILMDEEQRKVRISDTYRIKVNEKTSPAFYEAEYFSRGTYEQIYFALRLALGSLIGSGEEPLLLDDTLAYFDDCRVQKALELLKEIGKNQQVLLFTCHSRIKELGMQLSDEVKNLEEEIKDVC